MNQDARQPNEQRPPPFGLAVRIAGVVVALLFVMFLALKMPSVRVKEVFENVNRRVEAEGLRTSSNAPVLPVPTRSTA